MIREATADDIPRLLELSKRFHKKSFYADVEVIDAHVIYQLEAWLGDPNAKIFMSENGAIGVSFSKLFFNRHHINGGELFFYEEKGAPLMESAKQWLRSRGAKNMDFIFQGDMKPSRIAAAIRLFTRRGFRVSGISFQEKL